MDCPYCDGGGKYVVIKDSYKINLSSKNGSFDSVVYECKCNDCNNEFNYCEDLFE